MINPYAQSFLIATRTEPVAPARLRPTKAPKTRRGFFLFRRSKPTAS